MRYFSVMLFSFLLTIANCAETERPSPLLYQENYKTPLAISNQIFMTEIADTPESMQKGMMFRPTMADNQAMLFVYPTPQPMAFWMKNTRIPLDMLFFDANYRLQEIKANVPPCQTANCPDYPAKHDNNQYVIELKGGSAKKFGITVGDTFRLVLDDASNSESQ